MVVDLEKYRELKEARERDKRKKARETLKKYNTGKNKGQAKQAIKDAENLAKSATPWGMLSLFFQMKPFSDWMYGLALFAAVLKDLVDLIEATGIGYIVVVIATLCCSIFIAMMMLLGNFSNGAGRRQQKIIRSWLILLGGTTIELLFGINFLPVETLTVLIVYALLLAARKQAQTQQKEEGQSEAAYEEDYAEAA